MADDDDDDLFLFTNLLLSFKVSIRSALFDKNDVNCFKDGEEFIEFLNSSHCLLVEGSNFLVMMKIIKVSQLSTGSPSEDSARRFLLVTSMTFLRAWLDSRWIGSTLNRAWT